MIFFKQLKDVIMGILVFVMLLSILVPLTILICIFVPLTKKIILKDKPIKVIRIFIIVCLILFTLIAQFIFLNLMANIFIGYMTTTKTVYYWKTFIDALPISFILYLPAFAFIESKD